MFLADRRVLARRPAACAGPLAWFVSVWGVGGVALSLRMAIFRLGKRALLLRERGLAPFEWAVLVVCALAFAHGEGYRALHLRFSPRVIARVATLTPASGAGVGVGRALLAPLYALGLIQRDRARAAGLVGGGVDRVGSRDRSGAARPLARYHRRECRAGLEYRARVARGAFCGLAARAALASTQVRSYRAHLSRPVPTARLRDFVWIARSWQAPRRCCAAGATAREQLRALERASHPGTRPRVRVGALSTDGDRAPHRDNRTRPAPVHNFRQSSAEAADRTTLDHERLDVARLALDFLVFANQVLEVFLSCVLARELSRAEPTRDGRARSDGASRRSSLATTRNSLCRSGLADCLAACMPLTSAVHARSARRASESYARRDPRQTVLYRLVEQQLPVFLEQAREHGGVPGFVEDAFRDFLSCGILTHGLCRFRCSACRSEQLVALSCKGRGMCPSCGGKRMTDLAAQVVDRIVPRVPVRQWVLSLPHQFRYRLAYDHARMVAVFGLFVRAVLGFYARAAKARGLPAAQTGAITFVQRFGSAANLHVHAHVLVMDGVFTAAASGELIFHELPSPSDRELHALLAVVRWRVLRHLRRHGWFDDTVGDADPIAEEAPVLAACYRGSIARRQTLGARAGAPLARVGADRRKGWIERALGPLQAHVEGFDLHARLAIATDHAGGVGRLEKLVRYCARPPLSNERLSMRADGRVLLELKTPWSDGTTHLAYEPLDFLAKLAALVPRPHKNLVLYHGVLAARSRWRARVVAYRRDAETGTECGTGGPPAGQQRGAWAELMRRAFGYDLLACPRCGGKMVFLSCILRRDVIAKILARAGPVA